MVTSLVIRSEQTCPVVLVSLSSRVGDFLAELLRRQQSPQPGQFLITQPARRRYPRETSNATPSARTCKMFWRPSMPPNSPTVKSLNGSDGVANGPVSEQPATVNAAAATITPTRRPSLRSDHHNTMTNRLLA